METTDTAHIFEFEDDFRFAAFRSRPDFEAFRDDVFARLHAMLNEKKHSGTATVINRIRKQPVALTEEHTADRIGHLFGEAATATMLRRRPTQPCDNAKVYCTSSSLRCHEMRTKYYAAIEDARKAFRY